MDRAQTSNPGTDRLLMNNLVQVEEALLAAARRPGASADLIAMAARGQAGRVYGGSDRAAQAQ